MASNYVELGLQGRRGAFDTHRRCIQEKATIPSLKVFATYPLSSFLFVSQPMGLRALEVGNRELLHTSVPLIHPISKACKSIYAVQRFFVF